MKRLLLVLIVLCLLGSVFLCLPRNTREDTVYTSLKDLSGKKVAIQTGTSYEVYLAEKCPEAVPQFYAEFASIYPALQQGKADVMLTESISYAVEKMEIPSLERIEEPIATMELCIGVGNTAQSGQLERELNEFIARIREDGTAAAMKTYWLEDYDRQNAVVNKTGITGEKGELVINAEASFEPMCFAGKGGELTGYDVDFIYRFCRAYGYTPKIEPLSYDAMVAAMASGKSALAIGVMPDEERAQEVTFTDPFLTFDIIAAYDTGAGGVDSFLAGLAESFQKTFIRDARWKMFVSGIRTTLVIAVLATVFGSVLGLLLYQWCARGEKAEQRVTDALCWIMGSTPTVVLLMILYYIVFESYVISNLAVAVVGFTLLFGCEFYGLIVSGVKAVGTGQQEAARAQGFNADQTFFRIVFPQAMLHFLPGYENAVVALIQETSVVGYIAVMDLTKMSDLVRGRTFEPFFPLLATACIYFLLIWLLTAAVRYVARRLNTANRPKTRILRGIETK